MAFFTLRKIGITLGGLLALSTCIGVAEAITDTGFNYSTPKTRYLSISPMSLIPASDDTVAHGYGLQFDLGYAVTESANGCFTTGITLPHGAKITELKFFFSSHDTSTNAALGRAKYSKAGKDFIAHRSLPNSGGARQSRLFDIDETMAVVNNRDYIYDFGVCMGSSTHFYGARLTYTVRNAGD